MLFGYPIAATNDNWVHDTLVEALHTIHARLDAGETISEPSSLIPDGLFTELHPTTRRALTDRLAKYVKAVCTLKPIDRQRVATCLDEQNDIADLVTCTTECECLTDLPEVVRRPATDLFDFAFEMLTTLGVRDRHYRAIYDTAPYQVCPFCGCEFFDAPGAPREDLDHYLAKSRYPFAAANLRNLAPMGMKCNERYKQSQDILRDSDGKRRRAFNPYGDWAIGVTLDRSVPFGGADRRTPNWEVEFDPESPECKTWDDVFAVRERIERDVLNKRFSSWLGEFGDWCRSAGIHKSDDPAVINAIERWTVFLTSRGFDDRAFLKAAVFRMLLHWCRKGDRRLLNLMRNLVDEKTIQLQAG